MTSSRSIRSWRTARCANLALPPREWRRAVAAPSMRHSRLLVWMTMMTWVSPLKHRILDSQVRVVGDRAMHRGYLASGALCGRSSASEATPLNTFARDRRCLYD